MAREDKKTGKRRHGGPAPNPVELGRIYETWKRKGWSKERLALELGWLIEKMELKQ